MKPYVVAIDGPAGAGKSTLAKRLAKELNIAYIDTGAMYRTCALYAIESGIDPKADSPKLRSLLETAEIDFRSVNGEQKIFLNNQDVSKKIREPIISTGASDISAIPFVRDKLVQMQRNLAKGKSVLMDGRDIGTNVFPDAQVKIFLTADVAERANRRFLELQAKGDTSTHEQVLAEMIARDEQDKNRAYAPLRQAEDAHLLDTTKMDLEESFHALLQYTKQQLQNLI
ncbi:MAG: (d)CMP kinase [Ruminococcaceae bacterium]|nr:(d)CMP kinase [Oscillospiraceae bacterium]